MGTRKLGEQKRFSQKIWLSFSFFSAGSLDPTTNGRASRWQRICHPRHHSSKAWQLLPGGWETVYLSSSDSFVLSRQEPRNSHWSWQVACSGWDMPAASSRLPPRMNEKGLKRGRPHKKWPIQVLAPAILSLHLFRCSSLGACFLNVSLPCPVLEDLWEHWDAINSFYLMVWVREEQTTRSLFPKLRLVISWIMSELINLKLNIGWPYALMPKKKKKGSILAQEAPEWKYLKTTQQGWLI